MSLPLIVKKLVVKASRIQGLGVFAAEDLALGTIIEESHLIISKTMVPELNNYFFGGGNDEYYIALGFGSIYNHAAPPNAQGIFDKERTLITFTALKPIKQGEEITISYGANWFADRNLKEKKPSLWYRLKHSSTALVCLRFVTIVLTAILLVSTIKLSLGGLPQFFNH